MADLDGRGFIRRGNVLVPADFMAEEWMKSIPEGKEVLLDWRKPRHPGNHRHFMMILHLAVEQLDAYDDTEALLDALKLCCNHVRPVVTADGEVIYIPKSINFASLGEDEFRRFKNRAFYYLERILGYPVSVLEEEAKSRNARVQYDFDGDYHRVERPAAMIEGPPDDRPEPPPEAYDNDRI